MGAHSRYAPSSAKEWVKCPGFVNMKERYGTDDVNPVAEEGTAVHELAESLLKTGLPIEVASNGIRINSDMIDAANFYVSGLFALGLVNWRSEVQVECTYIHPDCWGTVDCVGVTGDTLFICDLKHGFGQVEAKENWQMITYASDLVTTDIKKVSFNIFQTRPVPRHRNWTVDVSELAPYWAALKSAALRASSPNPPLQAGDHCRYCPARHVCPSLESASFLAIEYAGDSTELTPDQISKHIDILRRGKTIVEYRLAGLEAQATSILKAGGKIPGYDLITTESNLKWTIPTAEVLMLGELWGVKVEKSDAVTPLQAVKAGLPKEVLSSYAARTLSVSLGKVEDDSRTITDYFNE